MEEEGYADVDGARLAFSACGPVDGAPVVLVHAGITDRRMWDPLLERLPAGRRAVVYDLRGFGASTWRAGAYAPHRDLLGLLDALGLERVDLVGASYGAQVALEAAAVAPDRVGAILALAPPLPDHPWSEALQEYGDAEERALVRGALEQAVELNLRTWVDGPYRQPGVVDPALRRGVGTALHRALEAQRRTPLGEEIELDPSLGERLTAVRAPVAVAVGELDQPDFATIGERLAAGLPRARLHRVTGAGHLPALERPDAVAALLAGTTAG